jgi:hypothetical protein
LRGPATIRTYPLFPSLLQSSRIIQGGKRRAKWVCRAVLARSLNAYICEPNACACHATFSPAGALILSGTSGEQIRHTPESHHKCEPTIPSEKGSAGAAVYIGRVSGHFEDRRCQPMIGAFGSRTFPSLCDRRHRHAEIWPRLSPNVVRHLCLLRAVP